MLFVINVPVVTTVD